MLSSKEHLGVAAWSARFTDFLHSERCKGNSEDVSIGIYFDRAIQAGLGVRALWWPEGEYIDVGVPDGLGKVFIGKAPLHGFEDMPPARS